MSNLATETVLSVNHWNDTACVERIDPRGRPMYWIGPPGDAEDDGPGTDFHAVREGYVSITPIHVDLTRYQALEKVGGWVSSLSMQENAA